MLKLKLYHEVLWRVWSVKVERSWRPRWRWRQSLVKEKPWNLWVFVKEKRKYDRREQIILETLGGIFVKILFLVLWFACFGWLSCWGVTMWLGMSASSSYSFFFLGACLREFIFFDLFLVLLKKKLKFKNKSSRK